MPMPKLKIGRYKSTGGTVSAPPVGAEWAGWIEPEDRSWILFIAQDGRPRFFSMRDADGGVKDDSLNLPAAAVAGTMLGRCQGLLGQVEWRWVNERGGLDGEAREISRAIMAEMQKVDINDVILATQEAMRKDGEQ